MPSTLIMAMRLNIIFSSYHLLIFGELIFVAEFILLLVAQAGKIAFPARAEVDVPPPEATQQGIGFLVVMCTEFAVFALMCHNSFIF